MDWNFKKLGQFSSFDAFSSKITKKIPWLALPDAIHVISSLRPFTRYDFCLRLARAIFVARAARVMEKSYTISTISNCLSLRLS